MLDLDTFEKARLIPVNRVKGSFELERRTTSILLAVASAVPEFGRSLIDPLGATGGSISTFAEPRFELDGQESRADGDLIRLQLEGARTGASGTPRQVEGWH